MIRGFRGARRPYSSGVRVIGDREIDGREIGARVIDGFVMAGRAGGAPAEDRNKPRSFTEGREIDGRGEKGVREIDGRVIAGFVMAGSAGGAPAEDWNKPRSFTDGREIDGRGEKGVREIDGRVMDGFEIDGLGENTGREIDGLEMDGRETDGRETDGLGENDGREIEGFEIDGLETDGLEKDGRETGGRAGIALAGAWPPVPRRSPPQAPRPREKDPNPLAHTGIAGRTAQQTSNAMSFCFICPFLSRLTWPAFAAGAAPSPAFRGGRGGRHCLYKRVKPEYIGIRLSSPRASGRSSRRTGRAPGGRAWRRPRGR